MNPLNQLPTDPEVIRRVDEATLSQITFLSDLIDEKEPRS